jgi:hypothetical protein
MTRSEPERAPYFFGGGRRDEGSMMSNPLPSEASRYINGPWSPHAASTYAYSTESILQTYSFRFGLCDSICSDFAAHQVTYPRKLLDSPKGFDVK